VSRSRTQDAAVGGLSRAGRVALPRPLAQVDGGRSCPGAALMGKSPGKGGPADRLEVAAGRIRARRTAVGMGPSESWRGAERDWSFGGAPIGEAS
jgi:hypothetical protein